VKRSWPLSMILAFLAPAAWAAAPEKPVPFPDALNAAAISVDRLDSILDYALLVGNGDVNALVYSEGGGLKLMLTKNDVWDARLDSKLDPPLPKLEWIKRATAQSQVPAAGRNTILKSGWGTHGPDSYHSHPYPCPRPCARLLLAVQPLRPAWQQIRREGSHNAWEFRDGTGVMSIQGAAGASNGYAFGPLRASTAKYPEVRVKVSGTGNARFYVDVMDADGRGIFGSGWQDSPAQPKEYTYRLGPGVIADRILLYSWTKDGKRAENRFAEVALAGPGGTLAVDLKNVVPPTCPARLDLARAVADVAGAADGVPKASIRALADRNVFLIEAAGDTKLLPIVTSDSPEATAGTRDGIQWIDQKIPGDLDWPGMSYAVALAAAGPRKVVAIVSSREAEDPRAAAVELARTALAAEPRELVARHEAAWQGFWATSGIELADPVLRAMWYRNLYFLRCVSKPGAIAPGLFASLIHDRPAWHGDYHTNYNIQQTFWAAYPANHPGLAEPYDRLIREYFPRARWLARQIFDMDGAFYPHVLFAYEPPHPEKCKSPGGRQYIHHVWGLTMGVPAFTVQPVWWHYKYEPDRKFLEETAYPAVRDVALWQAEFIDQCQGGPTVVLAPSVSPEHWGWTHSFERNRNCAFDIAMFRYTFEAAIEGATTLGRDAEMVARWRQALRRLPPYPTAKTAPPIVVDVEDAPPINYNIAVPAVPVFPGDVVTWWSPPAEKDLFRRTIEGLKWNGNNSSIMLSVARARLSMAGTSDWVRQTLLARQRPNGTLGLNVLGSTFNDFGHYTEQFAAGMAVSELLVQSVGDVVRVFPAWPIQQDAAFQDLRTQGGFLVTSEQKGGKVTRLEIASTAGGRLRLLSPWATISVRRGRGGQPTELKPDPRGVVEVTTEPGEHLAFDP
jgi:hypothetical protein